MTPLGRRALIGAAATVGSSLVLGGSLTARAVSTRPTRLFCWDTPAAFARGTHAGTATHSGGYLYIRTRQATTIATDPHTGIKRSYDFATWEGPITAVGFGATQLLPSWNAAGVPGTWVEVGVRGRTPTGAWSRWFSLGRWSQFDGRSDITRASIDGQSDSVAALSTDTVSTRNGATFTAVRVRVRMYRPAGTTITPVVRLLAVNAARPLTGRPGTSSPTGRPPVTLAVPRYSQQVHLGHYPQYNGGGEAWCSPTSVAMVLDYWKKGPSRSETAWVTQSGEGRPQVDHAARYCFDHTYDGTGNWPFCAAYASTRGLRSYVTRLRTLREAEQLVRAGVPLIASVSFSSAEMPGAGYSTAGHLLVIVGFTGTGDVVVNDPASRLQKTDAQVRQVYRRAAFEQAWIPKSGGLVYVIAPKGHPLPTAYAGEANWL